MRQDDKRLETLDLAPGLRRVSLSSRHTRRTGFEASCYQVDDLLIDTGFAHIRGLLMAFLEKNPPNQVALTHNHEDHCGAKARRRSASLVIGCPFLCPRVEALPTNCNQPEEITKCGMSKETEKIKL